MKILVIGGTGFIGKHVSRQLAARGHRVAVFHRGETAAELPATVQHLPAPAARLPIVEFPKPVLAFEPEIVIHTMLLGEADATAAAACFAGRVQRLVMLSSGDVYRAYGCFARLEAEGCGEGLLDEDSPLRTVLYPYRSRAATEDALEFWYEKILAERVIQSAAHLRGTILRLPKVYGAEQNSDLATIYRYRRHPRWRWTHGYVENVAAAIVLAAENEAAAGRVYNVGEESTPTVAERLAWLPPSAAEPEQASHFNFEHDIACDTSRIRAELGYREALDEKEAMLATLRSNRRS